jgi:hypothetical protein
MTVERAAATMAYRFPHGRDEDRWRYPDGDSQAEHDNQYWSEEVPTAVPESWSQPDAGTHRLNMGSQTLMDELTNEVVDNTDAASVYIDPYYPDTPAGSASGTNDGPPLGLLGRHVSEAGSGQYFNSSDGYQYTEMYVWQSYRVSNEETDSEADNKPLTMAKWLICGGMHPTD